MLAQDLADDIKSAMTVLNNVLGDHPENANPSDYADAFDNALKNFIQDNCQVIYSWTAVNSVPNPDPTTSFQASVNYASFSVGNQTDINAWSLAVSNQVLGGVITPDDSNFVVTPGSFLLTTPLVIPQSGLTNADAAMLYACDKIVTWLKLLINPVPVSGTHLVQYVGTGIMTSIS